MAEFLTTQGVAFNIERIIQHAKQRLVLISPYLQLSKTLYERLKDADSRGVRTVVIYGKDELKPPEQNQLKELKNLSLHYCDNLHAKCYFNEVSMVVTSMNMYEFSEKNNREMGVLLGKEADAEAFSAALNEFKSILDKSAVQEGKGRILYQQRGGVSNKAKAAPNTRISERTTLKDVILDTLAAVVAASKADGYCIRCHDRISIELSRPLCDRCYAEWAKYENPSYSEQYCHSCGRKARTSKEKPLCTSCYAKGKR